MFGQRIKKLRREKDMTQEDLAEALNISPQAVSRWETDLAMPDISILPSLAYLFNVTTDFLLGVDIVNKERAINDIIQKAECDWETKPLQEHIQSTIDMLREGLKLYPDSLILQNKLAGNLSVLSERKEHIPEIIKLCENILAKCTDNQIRYGATHTLCLAYKDIGEKDKAMELARSMPDNRNFLSNSLLALIESGNKKIDILQRDFFEILWSLHTRLQSLIFAQDDEKKGIFSYEEKVKLLKKLIEIWNIIFEEKEHKNGLLMLGNAYYFMFVAQLNQQYSQNDNDDFHRQDNIETALEYLEEGIQYKIGYFSPMEEDIRQSLIFRGSSIYKENREISLKDAANSCASTFSLLSKNFDYLKDNERFKNIIATLEKYAKKRKTD